MTGRIRGAITASRTRFWRFRDRAKQWMHGRRHTANTFTWIYEKNLWGDNESVSGAGSSRAATEVIRTELPALLGRLGIGTLLDAPCGNFSWIKDVVGGLRWYIGVDVVQELIDKNRAEYAGETISFFCLDICTNTLPKADTVLCRDCFIHLPTALIYAALRNFRSTGARYLLLTNCADAGLYHDIPVGSFRPIDFRRPPFCFPEPIHVMQEVEGSGRQLCLWELDTLQLDPAGS